MIVPRQIIDLTFATPGVVGRIPVALGDRVEAGALACALETGPLEAERLAARAGLAAARADRAEAELELEGAEASLVESRTLADEGALSRTELRAAILRRDRAAAHVERAAAMVEQHGSMVTLAQERLAAAELRAPVSGVVSRIHAAIGERVSAGDPVVRLLGGDPFVRFALPVAQRAAVAPGQPVWVVLPDRTHPLRAEVRRFSPDLEDATQTIFVEAELLAASPPEASPSPGLPATVWLVEPP